MATYTDNIKVKISEKYKPPPRINLVTSYAQRLNLNKQVQNNIPNYDFSLEKYVLQKMKEWKENKLLVMKERQSNLELRKQKFEAKKESTKDVKANIGDESLSPSSNYSITSTCENMTNISQDTKYTMPNHSMLIPTQVSNCYSNILKPTQLQNYEKQIVNKEIDKKYSFNFSDFEDDTSSPFDNMELKSINDLEQLAQVLNKEDYDHKVKNKVVDPQSYQTGNSHSSQVNYNDYLSSGYSGNQCLHHIPTSLPSVGSNNENFIYSNGYKYQTEYSQFNQQYHTPYSWAKLNNEYNPFQQVDINAKMSNCKRVPDLVNTLEVELENTHIADSSFVRSDEPKLNVEECRPKTDDNSIFLKRSQNEIDLVTSLTKDEQKLCKSISVMGFPIERVARVYKLLGSDEKKIVEHLLAMSDLLDLGFQEKDVSIALLECDNDRDKALDKLIA